MSTIDETMQALAQYIPKDFAPKIGIILGSGLSSLAEQMTDPVSIPYAAIPGLQESKIAGHASLIVLGHLNDIPVVCLRGRLHLYEGIPYEAIRTLIQIVKKLGLEIIRRFEKKRTSYLVSKDGKNVKVEIDTIPGVPTYLEVEANDEAAVRWGVQLVGFTMEQTSNKGIHEMWEKYYKGKTEVYFKDYPNKN